jgi:hypothetical protein
MDQNWKNKSLHRVRIVRLCGLASDSWMPIPSDARRFVRFGTSSCSSCPCWLCPGTLSLSLTHSLIHARTQGRRRTEFSGDERRGNELTCILAIFSLDLALTSRAQAGFCSHGIAAPKQPLSGHAVPSRTFPGDPFKRRT